jgi:nucleoid-associated protein YgaU
MSAPRFVAACLLGATLVLAGGCGGSGNTVTTDETSDAVYQQAQDYKKQGRYNEALNGFLKEIDRRGENGAPESHLEAGALYLNWSHNPVEAYHHFSKYLELQPTGPRAAVVRGQREAAMRDIARYLLAPANQGIATDRNEDVDALRRQIEELKAENQTLRGAAGMPVPRPAPMIALPQPNAADANASDTEITPVATPPASSSSSFTHSLPAPTIPASSARNTAASAQTTRVPVIGPSAAGAERVAATPTRPGAASRNAPPPSGGRRSHTVTAGEKSLWGIARQYYGGSVSQARVTALYEANRDVMHSANDLRPGMVLRIP